MGEYTSAINLADRLIRKKGTTITLVERIISAPTDGSDVGVSQPVYYRDIPALVLPPDTMTEQAYATQTLPGSSAVTKVRNVTVPAKSCPVRISHTMQVEGHEGETWQIVGVKEVSPGGDPIVYQFTMKV